MKLANFPATTASCCPNQKAAVRIPAGPWKFPPQLCNESRANSTQSVVNKSASLVTDWSRVKNCWFWVFSGSGCKRNTYWSGNFSPTPNHACLLSFYLCFHHSLFIFFPSPPSAVFFITCSTFCCYRGNSDQGRRWLCPLLLLSVL